MRATRLASFSSSVFVAVLATHGVSTAQLLVPPIGRVPPPPAILSAATRTDLSAIPEPSGYGHYCSLSYASGGWAFVTTGAGTDPCADALRSSPGGTIARAGLWSTGGSNNVLVRCGGDVRIYRETGSKPTAQAFAEAKGKKDCVFVVSPTELKIFGRPYGKTTSTQANVDSDVSHTNGFDYAQFGKKLDPSMFGQSGTSASIVDRFGRAHSDGQGGHDGHDWLMPEGKPILAVADGLVLSARERDVSEFNCGSTDKEKRQTEIYVLHAVGTGEYQERFVSYYAHMKTMAVASGARVTRGQQIGTAGDRGCSTGSHLHMGTTRLTNLTGSRYHPFQPISSAHGDTGFGSRIDPYGWKAPKHIDPWAWMFIGTFTDTWGSYKDPGAFSLGLWLDGQAPPADNW